MCPPYNPPPHLLPAFLLQVRIWRVARSQADILAHMRGASGLERHPDLAAYWTFNDPEERGLFRSNLIAKDSSGRGNDLRLVTFPTASRVRVARGAQSLDAGALTFRNNYAMNQGFRAMPQGDITVEFWARLPALNNSQVAAYNEFFSFAANVLDPGGRAPAAFADDAILIERYTEVGPARACRKGRGAHAALGGEGGGAARGGPRASLAVRERECGWWGAGHASHVVVPLCTRRCNPPARLPPAGVPRVGLAGGRGRVHRRRHQRAHQRQPRGHGRPQRPLD